MRASRHEPRVLSGDWSALIASGRGGIPRLEDAPDGFSGDTSGTADRLAVTARSSARIGPHGDSIEPAGFEIRHLITACEQIVDWIRFAGIKAALVLTVDGIFASVLVPTISRPHAMNARRRGARRLGPVRRVGKLGRAVVYGGVSLHPAEGARRGAQSVRDFDRRAAESFRNQVLIGMMVEAHISKSKYRHVIASIKLLTAAAPLGFAYLAALGIAT